MKRSTQLIVIVLFGASASFALGLLRGGSSLASYRWGPDAIRIETSSPSGDTQARARRILATRLIPEGQLGVEVVGPSTASLLRRGPDGSLFLLDYGTGEILDIDPATGLSRVWVQAWPPPVDFDLLPSGALLWIRDTDSVLRIHDAFGFPSREVPWPEALSRLVATPAGGLVGLGDGEAADLFRHYGSQGQLRQAFGRFLAGEVQDQQLLEGCLSADTDGGFVYAPHYLPFIARFTFEGQLLYVRPLVGSKLGSPPSIVRGPHGSRNIEAGTRIHTETMHLSGGRLALLTEIKVGLTATRLLDFYDRADGAYLHSLELPAGTRDAHLSGDEIFTLHRDGIRRWRLEEPTGSDSPPKPRADPAAASTTAEAR